MFSNWQQSFFITTYIHYNQIDRQPSAGWSSGTHYYTMVYLRQRISGKNKDEKQQVFYLPFFYFKKMIIFAQCF